LVDRTVDRVLYLDPDTHATRSYPGNYSAFAAARRQERASQLATWQQQEEYVDRVRRDVARLKSEALAVERATTPRQPGIRRQARKKARLALAREHKLARYLASDERVDKPHLTWPLHLDFGAPPPGGRAVLSFANVNFAYADCEPLLQDVSFDVRFGQRVALVGPNGAGKTTLVRLIQGADGAGLAPSTGCVRLGVNVRLGVLAQEQETLDPARSVLDTVLAERPMGEAEARRLLSFFLFHGSAAHRRVASCSLGEKTRLQLACLVLRGCNLLLLDEPLNHLDVDGREHFQAALDAFHGTIIAVAHDRAFLRAFAERVIEIRAGRAEVFEGGYDAFTRRTAEAPRGRDFQQT
jgi:ATP-binding cassette subfamily F protein 3